MSSVTELTLKDSIIISKIHYKMLQPLLISSRFLGLAPISSTKSKNNCYILKWSTSLAFYSYTFLLIQIFGTIAGGMFSYKLTWQSIIENTPTLNIYVKLMDYVSHILIIAFAIATSTHRVKIILSLIYLLSKVDKILKTIWSKQFTSVFRNYIIRVFVIYIFVATIDLTSKSGEISKAGTTFQNFFIYYLLQMSVRFEEAVVISLFEFINIRVISLNNCLKNVEHTIRLKNLESKGLFSLDFHVVSDHRRNNATERDDASQKLTDVVGAYEIIEKCVQIVNDSFSLNIIMIVINCLIHLVVTPYFLLAHISSKNKKDMVFILSQLLWCCWHAERIIKIVEPCHQVLKNLADTKITVWNLLREDLKYPEMAKIEYIMRKLCSSPIQFRACGFFDIDRSLLTSIAGSATTYLVILFQFIK